MDTPTQNTKQPQTVHITQELQASFLDYAMSVVVSRAIPDVRDGLKPVHRRVLYTMHQLGFTYNKPYHKSVRVVGEVLGKYHPHGDQAVYNTIAGMVQDFSKRYPLLDGQGNWGSIDGDNPAAMRYTEVRMHKIAQEMLYDLEKDTVSFVPNFDESTQEPVILPNRLPHLLINGTAGIAVGMATSIPPHNLGEVIDGCLALLDNPELTSQQLCQYIPGPDFPTGGILCGRAHAHKAYQEGRSTVVVRGVVHTETTKQRTSLVVTELPYQVVKSDFIVKVAELVKNKSIDGITNIRDESDKHGIRIVIDLRKGEIPEVITNQLYKHTNLQVSISMYMLALLDNTPILFTLHRFLKEFLTHREHVVYHRSLYDLRKAQAREHILQGFMTALGYIDDIVQLIKSASDTASANTTLQEKYGLSETQARAILDMKLHRLTGLEQEKIHNELQDIQERIAYFQRILDHPDVLRDEIRHELRSIKAAYADARRTQIGPAIDALSESDLIPDDEVLVTLTRKGYIKRVPLSTYSVQQRGGRGKVGLVGLDDTGDVIQDVFAARNHDELLFFTNFGRVYSKRVFEIPEASRTAKGRAIVNVLSLQEDEYVVKLLCSRDLADTNLVMATRNGVIKRTKGEAFDHIRSTGIRGITLADDDELAFCTLNDHEDDAVLLATRHGQGIRFPASEVRLMGRPAGGVRGISLKGDDYVVGLAVARPEEDVLFATECGYGKRVQVGDFRLAHRGGTGVRTIPTTKRNGYVIGLSVVDDTATILLIDSTGKIVRLAARQVRTMSRQAQGVRLIRLHKDQRLVACLSVPSDDQESEHTHVTPRE